MSHTIVPAFIIIHTHFIWILKKKIAQERRRIFLYRYFKNEFFFKVSVWTTNDKWALPTTSFKMKSFVIFNFNLKKKKKKNPNFFLKTQKEKKMNFLLKLKKKKSQKCKKKIASGHWRRKALPSLRKDYIRRRKSLLHLTQLAEFFFFRQVIFVF